MESSALELWEIGQILGTSFLGFVFVRFYIYIILKLPNNTTIPPKKKQLICWVFMIVYLGIFILYYLIKKSDREINLFFINGIWVSVLNVIWQEYLLTKKSIKNLFISLLFLGVVGNFIVIVYAKDNSEGYIVALFLLLIIFFVSTIYDSKKLDKNQKKSYQLKWNDRQKY